RRRKRRGVFMKKRTTSLASATLVLSAIGAPSCGAADSGHFEPNPDEDIGAVAQEATVGGHLSGVNDTDFGEALTAFATVEDPNDGLGPIFNETACGNCHSLGAVGGAGTQIERRFGKFNSDGTFNPLANEGGSLRQLKTLGKWTNSAGKACNVPLEV